jgi:hypothetical protein
LRARNIHVFLQRLVKVGVGLPCSRLTSALELGIADDLFVMKPVGGAGCRMPLTLPNEDRHE